MRPEVRLLHSATAQIGDEFRTEPSSPEWFRVEPEHVEAVWAAMLPMVERGLRHGQGDGTTAAAMYGQILLGNFSLWACVRDGEVIAGMVFQLRPQITGTKLWIHMLAGRDSDFWADELEGLLSDLLVRTGAMCVETSARRGLAKILKKRGWREKAAIMELK